VALPHGFFDPTVPITQHLLALADAIDASATPHQTAWDYPLPALSDTVINETRQLLPTLPPHAPTVVLAPATQWESKHWPAAYWTELLRQILEQTSWHVVLIGMHKDMGLVQTILAPLDTTLPSERLHNLTGKTTLSQLQAVLSLASVVVGPDSAPLHLAGALAHPRLIGLYGPSAYRRTPPPQPRHPATLLTTEGKLACQPCDAARCAIKTHACMQDIHPEQVFTALSQYLSRTP
jgi:ADP-heptose:LPS heptosyltransferase